MLEQVSVGSDLSCGVRADGTLWCWGNNKSGRAVGEPKSDVVGVRFHLAESFAITLRLGTPSLLLGASFFL